MRKRLSLFLVLVLMFSLLVGCSGDNGESVTTSEDSQGTEESDVVKDEDIYVAVISKGFQHEFWQTVKMGCDKAGEELGIRVTFEGPEAETMIAEQVDMVQNAISKNATAILLAPLDEEALVPVVEEANEKGLPVLTFDSSLKSDIPLSFVATDNKQVGAIAAEKMAELIGGKGKVGIIAHNEGTSTAIDRRDGFIEKIEADYPDIEIVGVRYSDGDHQKALNETTDMLTRNPDLAGIYATNEGAVVGTATAVQENNRGGELVLIGVDSSEAEINFLKDGVITGFVVQNPYNMGYLGVKATYDAIKGKSVEPRIDTGATYIDLNNLEDEDIQKLLYPLGK